MSLQTGGASNVHFQTDLGVLKIPFLPPPPFFFVVSFSSAGFAGKLNLDCGQVTVDLSAAAGPGFAAGLSRPLPRSLFRTLKKHCPAAVRSKYSRPLVPRRNI